MLIDTHAHLNFSAFKDDADEVISRTLEEGVFMINVGSQYSTSVRAVKYAEKYETGVWAAVGIHPVHLQKRNIKYVDPNELETEEEHIRNWLKIKKWWLSERWVWTIIISNLMMILKN
jgi:Tat protein secretion system quality control protein TatD with DNase activity